MTRTRDQILADIADNVSELTQPYQHSESHTVRIKTWYKPMTHTADHSSLLDQLRECVTDRPRKETEERVVARPNVQRFDADAQNRLDAINNEVAGWRQTFGMEPRGWTLVEALRNQAKELMGLFPRGMPTQIARAQLLLLTFAEHHRDAYPVEPDLRAFVGAAPGLTTPNLHLLAADVSRWRWWCRIVADWERPARQPQVPCPHCGERPDQHAGLRIHYEIKSAVCLSCSATWSPDGVPIEILGEHARSVREALEESRLALLADAGPYPPSQNRGGRS